MVDPWMVAIDAASYAVSLALPAALWAALFLLAWDHGPFAESIGLDRTAFWLLLPGALLASFALLPIAPIANDWIAISFAGALLPLIVGAATLRRVAPPARTSLARLLGYLTVEAAVALALVLPVGAALVDPLGSATRLGAAGAEVLAVTLVGAGVTGFVAVRSRWSGDPMFGRVALLVGLASAVLVLTFAGSSAIPGVGIVESFPYFLLPPILAGLAAGLLAPRVFPRAEGLALPSAFLATTLGVLIGADVLREPPLYGHGAAGLYAIGGAGVSDLVYLSGLLGLGAAYLTHIAWERGWTPVGPPLPTRTPSALQQLRAAFQAGVGGDVAGSLSGSVGAARAAADEARRLLGAPPASTERPWEGLPVPGWIVSDHANLERVARSGTTDSREAYRGWLMARWLVFVGHELSLRRFASVAERLAAFLLDLAIVSAPAMLAFVLIARSTPGGYDDLATNVAFNAAIVGFVSVALLYFALGEATVGTTVGKWTLGLSVRDRALRAPDARSSLARNLPLAPILTVIGVGGAIAVAVATKGVLAGGPSILGVSVPAGLFAGLGIVVVVAGGVALLGSFGVLAMLLSWERQRVGDLWAGTWVVRDPRDGPTGPPRTPPPSPPAGAGRSG